MSGPDGMASIGRPTDLAQALTTVQVAMRFHDRLVTLAKWAESSTNPVLSGHARRLLADIDKVKSS